jgi:hypothetical protein
MILTKKKVKFIHLFKNKKNHTRNVSPNIGLVVPFLIPVLRLLSFDLSGNK